MSKASMARAFRGHVNLSEPYEPTTNDRHFSPDYPSFRQYARTGASRYYGLLRGDRFGRVYAHNPEQITIQEFDEMRMDGQVRAGLMLLKVPIQKSRWAVTCDDKDIANFCTEFLKPIWADFIRHVLLALDFGFITGEICWSNQYNRSISSSAANLGGAGKKVYPVATVIDRIMMIDPLTVKLLAFNRSGIFAGFEQFSPITVQVPYNKAFHFANELEFQELYGVSRIKPCYPYWYFKRSMYEWTNIGYEKNSIPIRKVRYPEGREEIGVNQDGTPQYSNNDEKALEIGEGLDNNNVVAIPSGVYDGSKLPYWDIEFLENPFNGQEILAYIDHLNAQILKALLIPELALNTGSSGSYDLAQEQIRFFMIGLEALMDQIAEAVTSQLLNRLVKANFGSGAPATVFTFQPLADDVKEGLVNVLMQTVGSGMPVPLVDGNEMLVDWQKVAEDSGIPVQILTEEDAAMFKAKMQPQQDPYANGYQEGGDMPFGAPPGGDQGGQDQQFGQDRGGFGAPGGASNRPQNMDRGLQSDQNPGEIGLSESTGLWIVSNGELKWSSSVAA